MPGKFAGHAKMMKRVRSELAQTVVNVHATPGEFLGPKQGEVQAAHGAPLAMTGLDPKV